MISDEELARILLNLRRPQPPPTMNSDEEEAAEALIMLSQSQPLEVIEIEDSLPFLIPRKKRSNRKRSVRVFPCVQPKKAKRKTDDHPTRASSSGTRGPTPEWLLEWMALKNGTGLMNIIEKELTACDVSRGHSRLSMPLREIIDLNFLTPEEEEIKEKKAKGDRKKGVDAKLGVKVADSNEVIEFDNLNLRRWKSGSSFVYNLVTGWSQVVEVIGLKVNDNIRVWSFHSDGVLYFALLAPPSSGSGETSSAPVICDKSNGDLPPK